MRKIRQKSSSGWLSKSLLIVSTITSIFYLVWRGLYTIPSTGLGLVFGLAFFFIEIWLTFNSLLLYVLLYKPSSHTEPPEVPEDAPVVDVFIATYDEPISVLKRTIAASKNLIYPKQKLNIWVCDDGNRSEVKELADQLHVQYINRNINDHAKAGNMNNAMSKTSGELILILDADMIPKPEFLQRTAGFFNDLNVGFVQTPQSFYNNDIFQYNLFQQGNIPNEQDFFMRLIQSGRDRFNASIFVGTNAIFRRKALKDVGGFATGTITEDMATGLLIQAKGYKTIMFDEVLAQGLATESLSDLINQRIRWARGTIQTMRLWNPLKLKGLTIMQRLLYMSAWMYWYFGIIKLFFMVAPLLYLYFHIQILNTTFTQILSVWLPYYIISSLVMQFNTGKMARIFWSNLHEVSIYPALAKAAIVETFTKKSIAFKVTPKGIQTAKSVLNKHFVTPHIVLLCIYVFGIILGLLNLKYSPNKEIEPLAIVLFWAFYNVVFLGISIMLGLERPRMRSTERFRRSLNVELVNSGGVAYPGMTLDISENGCSILLDKMVPIRENMEIKIYGKENDHTSKARLVFYDNYGTQQYQAGFSFDSKSEEDYQRWILEVYGSTPKDKDFQYKASTGMLNVVSKYLKNFRYQYRSKVRNSPRVSTNMACSLRILPNDEIAVAIEDGLDLPSSLHLEETSLVQAYMSDVGLYGCQVQIMNDEPINIGSNVELVLSSSSKRIISNVTRIVKAKNGQFIGLQWKNVGYGIQLIEQAHKDSYSKARIVNV